jgi:hypothetical protein
MKSSMTVPAELTMALHTRRQLTLGLGLGALLPWASADAQSPSEAALEAVAPPMPQVGDVLKVPSIRLLNGQNFQTERQPLLL